MLRFVYSFALAVVSGAAAGSFGHFALLSDSPRAQLPTAPLAQLDARQRMAKLVAETAAHAAAQAARSVVEQQAQPVANLAAAHQ